MRYRLRTLLIVLAVVSAYFASYVALMQPAMDVEVGHLGVVVVGHSVPRYRLAEPVSSVLFWPAAWLDQKLRRAFWTRFPNGQQS